MKIDHQHLESTVSEELENSHYGITSGENILKKLLLISAEESGTGLQSIAQMIEKDATYGLLHRFLYGIKSERLIEIKDEKKGKLIIDGIPVTILREARNPVDIHGAIIMLTSLSIVLENLRTLRFKRMIPRALSGDTL